MHERGDVVRAFAKRWHTNRENTEAVEQVASEGASCDHRFEMAIRGGDQASVDALCASAAEPLEFLLLQCA